MNHLYSLEINAESFTKKTEEELDNSEGTLQGDSSESNAPTTVVEVPSATIAPPVQVSRKGRIIKPPPGHSDYIKFE